MTTWTHTTLETWKTGTGDDYELPSGDNLVLLCIIADDDIGAPTWDGDAMTEAYKSTQVYGEITVWMLDVTADAGLTKTFAITSTDYGLVVVDGIEATVVDSTYQKATHQSFVISLSTTDKEPTP